MSKTVWRLHFKMRKTKIVCTIGPASESVDTLVKLMEAGMNVARLNFSHGDHEEHKRRIANIREAAKKTNKTVGILLDTKGPEIRTHNMENGAIQLQEGNELVISMTEMLGNPKKISVTYDKLIYDVDKGTKILLDDGLIELEVTGVNLIEKEIHTKVLNGGILKDKKGVNVPGVSINLPGITEKDAEDIMFGIEQDVDFIAASFVRRTSDVLEIRKILEENNGGHIRIIPKIENREGVENIDEILEVSDGLMVARGDLGVEIPAEEVPLVQKSLIRKCNQLGKPVITATQMLDSMQRNPRPTRAEASDVANAILDGTDAIMLSGETAAGMFPVEAVRTMHSIADWTESAIDHRRILSMVSKETKHNITDAISQSVAHTALNLDVKAIITPTVTGYTAQMVSKYRPKAPIIAVTSSERTLRRLTLVWGVYPQLGSETKTTDDMLDIAVQEGIKSKIVKHGDVVVITAGVPAGVTRTTNMMKIHIVGDILVKGQGIGRKSTHGKIVIARDGKEALSKVTEGSILVAISTDAEMVPSIEKCKALITEEGGLTSHGAVVALELGIPVIVGAKGATELLKDGQDVTVDANQGVVYNGYAGII